MNPLLAFLDGVERPEDARRRRERSYQLVGAGPAQRVVDVGCGAGTAVRELAARVASATGIDVNEPLLEAARERATGTNATFIRGDAEALPLADESADGYRAERLYQHLPSATKALAEAHRVLAPGGRIVLVDQHWDATLLDSDDPRTTRTLLRAFADGIPNRDAPLRFHRQLREAGFEDVHVETEAVASASWEDYGWFPELVARVAEASGAVPSAVASAWLDDQRARAERGCFFLVMVWFLGHARRARPLTPPSSRT